MKHEIYQRIERLEDRVNDLETSEVIMDETLVDLLKLYVEKVTPGERAELAHHLVYHEGAFREQKGNDPVYNVCLAIKGVLDGGEIDPGV